MAYADHGIGLCFVKRLRFVLPVMTVRKSGSRVLWYEAFGFALIILLSWFNELVDLPRYLVGGGPHYRDFRDSMVTTIVVLLIALVVLRLTRQLLARLHYLEGMLRVCAWCRKIGQDDKWVRIEDYFAHDFQIQTTHGMCPECLKKMEEDTKQFFRKRSAVQTAEAEAKVAA